MRQARAALIFILILISMSLLSKPNNNLTNTNRHGNRLPFKDRIRNVPAVSPGPGETSNMIHITSFGLKPYRLSPTLEGQDAFLFRATITNSEFGWFFDYATSACIQFNQNFEDDNPTIFDGFGRNAYTNDDLTNMNSYFDPVEASARFEGGTGCWTSPVLVADNQLIILNKSGIIMGMANSFATSTDLLWAYDLRTYERDENNNHYKYEFMSTPTIIGDDIFVAGISHIFKINLTNMPLQSDIPRVVVNSDLDDFFCAPIAYDLNDQIQLIAVSNKGKVIVFDESLNNTYTTSNLAMNQEFITRPIVDADGQIYITSENGKIYHFSQENMNPAVSEFQEIDCGTHKFASTLITDSSKSIYAFSECSDILNLEEIYTYPPDPPEDPLLNYEWNSSTNLFTQTVGNHYRVLNNHSTLFERYNGNVSCLTTIYNSGNSSFIPDDNYYHNFNPDNYMLTVMLLNTLNPNYGIYAESGQNSATFGGVAPYVTNSGCINVIFPDDHGYVWSWDVCEPTDEVGYPYINGSPIINDYTYPKFMKNLTNVTEYNTADVTIYFPDQNLEDYEGFYLNSYSPTTQNQHVNGFTIVFENVLEHPNYNLAFLPVGGNPVVFENFSVSSSTNNYSFGGTLTVHYGNTVTLDSNYANSYHLLFNTINIEPGGVLNIAEITVEVLDEVLLYNQGTIDIYDDGHLQIDGMLKSQQFGNETNPGVISNTNGIYPFGSADINNVEVTEQGKFCVNARQDVQTSHFSIKNITINQSCDALFTSPATNLLNQPIKIYGDMQMFGTLIVEDVLHFEPGSSCVISGQNAEFSVEDGESSFINAELLIEEGGLLNIKKTDDNDSEMNLLNSTAVISDTGSKIWVEDCVVNLNNSGLQISNSGQLTLDQFDENSSGSELNLSNASEIVIDGANNANSELKIDWGSTISGATSGQWEQGQPGIPIDGDEGWIPGDRIIAKNGGRITTENLQSFENHSGYPDEVPIITINSSSSELWDGIYIENPDEGDQFWFVNCNISDLVQISIKNISESNNVAELKLYHSNFMDSGQIVVMDGHILYIIGVDDPSYFVRNANHPICAYESTLIMDNVSVGNNTNNANESGIYIYGTGGDDSEITNCIFKSNEGDGVRLNGSHLKFNNNSIEDNNFFGMMCFPGAEFIGDVPFDDNSIFNNGYAEFVGWHDTYNMGSERENIKIYDEDFGSNSDNYLLINPVWSGGTQTDIQGVTTKNENGDFVPISQWLPLNNGANWNHLRPNEEDAWNIGGEIPNQRQMLNSAANDISAGNYAIAEQTLQQIISVYPLTQEAGSAVFYLFYTENHTDKDFSGLIDYLSDIDAAPESHLEYAKRTIITKSYIKDKEYATAIERLENIIDNSQIPDEVILAMIDEGYCYMEMAESGDRALPAKCAVKTPNLASYQPKLKELISQLSFYPQDSGNNIIPAGRISEVANYPNPFNPTTTIAFSLSTDSDVSINIYNIKGQKVKQLVKEQLEAGKHSVNWSGKDNSGKSVASGIYFYKISTGKDTDLRKMLLLK